MRDVRGHQNHPWCPRAPCHLRVGQANTLRNQEQPQVYEAIVEDLNDGVISNCDCVAMRATPFQFIGWKTPSVL